MRTSYQTISFKKQLLALLLAVLPLSATPMQDGFELPRMHFDNWDGYNSFQYASQETAQFLAQMMGGEVVETYTMNASTRVPAQRLIYLGGQRYLNAGLVALTLMNNPYDIAMQMIILDGYSFSGETEAWQPQSGSFITPFVPADPGINPPGGGLPNGPNPPVLLPGQGGSIPQQETAEPAALVLFGSGLLALSLLGRRFAA